MTTRFRDNSYLITISSLMTLMFVAISATLFFAFCSSDVVIFARMMILDVLLLITLFGIYHYNSKKVSGSVMEEENIPAITSLSYHEIRKRYREKTDELNEKRLNVVSDYVQLVMSPYLKESDVNMLINNINLWLESEDNILIPVTTGGRLTTLDLRHLAWNIGERFNWKGIKRALFIKLVFPIEMRELEVETIRRNLRQNGNCIIELDIPEKGFFEFSISSRPTQNLLSHAGN